MRWPLACNLVGSSPAFLRALERIERFAGCDAPVLVCGETGTGKELAARAVHYLSRRKAMPFVPVNCGALPDTLLESELFGHARGAFTDARSARKGLLREAEGGTVFLDEIEALSPRGQVQLLRFLQDRLVRPVGGDAAADVDVRVVAASNVELSLLADRGAFRSDLFFRLDVLTVRLPALRERSEDIAAVSAHFLLQFARDSRTTLRYLSAAALALLETNPWPGNIRELQNCLMRAQLLTDGVEIDAQAIALCLGEARSPVTPDVPNLPYREAKARAIDAFEREFLGRLLRGTNGNIAEAARLCRKDRSALSRLVAKHRTHLG